MLKWNRKKVTTWYNFIIRKGCFFLENIYEYKSSGSLKATKGLQDHEQLTDPEGMPYENP